MSNDLIKNYDLEKDKDYNNLYELIQSFPLEKIKESIDKKEIFYPPELLETKIIFTRTQLFKNWIDIFSYALDLFQIYIEGEDPFLTFEGNFLRIPPGIFRKCFSFFLKSFDHLAVTTSLHEDDLEELVFSTYYHILCSITKDKDHNFPNQLNLFRTDDDQIFLCRQQ